MTTQVPDGGSGPVTWPKPTKTEDQPKQDAAPKKPVSKAAPTRKIAPVPKPEPSQSGPVLIGIPTPRKVSLRPTEDPQTKARRLAQAEREREAAQWAARYTELAVAIKKGHLDGYLSGVGHAVIERGAFTEEDVLETLRASLGMNENPNGMPQSKASVPHLTSSQANELRIFAGPAPTDEAKAKAMTAIVRNEMIDFSKGSYVFQIGKDVMELGSGFAYQVGKHVEVSDFGTDGDPYVGGAVQDDWLGIYPDGASVYAEHLLMPQRWIDQIWPGRS